MGFEKGFFAAEGAVLLCIACTLLLPGCGRGDINLVKNATYGDHEMTIGLAFDGCSQFTSTSWKRLQYEANHPIVVFVAGLPVKALLETVYADSSDWIPSEKAYLDRLSPQLAGAYLRITFPLADDDTFRLGDIMFGIASRDSTVWSPSLPPEERERVIQCIYEDSPEILSELAPYANPSLPQGSTLLHTLTGKSVSQNQ
ncbi:MAG: hypothetical protein WAR22_01320 [Desulfomonilia bacterium]|jgi:hypothetical protein